MAETVLLPQQGNSVESVILLQWNKQEGETIQVGDVLCEVETDKTTMEVESTAAGTVLKHLVTAGDEVPVKTAIAVIGEAGENVENVEVDTPAPEAETAHEQAAETSTEPAPVRAADAATVTGKVTERPTDDTTTETRPGASPRARMRAAEKGLSPDAVTRLTGSGPGGRVIEQDVLHALDTGDLATTEVSEAAAHAPAGASPAAATPAPVTEIKVAGIRKVIAQRMRASLETTAQFTLHGSADARAMQTLRKRFKQEGEALGLAGVNINDMVMFAVSRTLPDFPELNAHFETDVIRRFSRVDLSFAVDTERGLMVPTVPVADSLTLRAMSGTIRTLSERCIGGKATAEDLTPGTFTVTNLGSFGVEYFTPVLNPPQVAILGVNTIQPKPVYNAEGAVEHIPHIGLSLTIDHQAVDGAPAARFLRELSNRIARIDLLTAW